MITTDQASTLHQKGLSFSIVRCPSLLHHLSETLWSFQSFSKLRPYLVPLYSTIIPSYHVPTSPDAPRNLNVYFRVTTLGKGIPPLPFFP
jgi:hypothetical protein